MRLYMNPKEAAIVCDALVVFEEYLHRYEDKGLLWNDALDISNRIEILLDRIELCDRLQHNERQGGKNV